MMERRPIHPAQLPKTRRERAAGWAFTAGVHVAVIAALFWSRESAPPAKRDETHDLAMVTIAPSPKPPGPVEPEKPLAEEQAPPPMERQSPITFQVKATSPLPVDNSDILSETQLAGASSVGDDGAGGGGGGGCDTARAVQAALRADPLVHNAVADANRTGKAIMMWNGDWVRSGAQEGKGLSAVRQAIMWKVAFASESCRNETMHGTVVLSLADGATRFAIGTGAWRWSDLLGIRR